jgi:flagellar protein FliO/FliZ
MKQGPAESSSEAPSAGGLLLRTLGALLLILGLLVAAAWSLRRFGGGRLAKQDPAELELAVLTTLPLGERRSISAVRFGDQLLLLGATAQTVTLLAKTARSLPAAAAAPPRMRSVAELLADDEPRETVQPNFERALLLAKEQLGRSSHEEFSAE